MLFLQIPLLAVLFPGGDNEEAFQISYTGSFYNNSWANSWASSWLGEVQIHGWDSKSNSAVFLWSWSKSNFKEEEITQMEAFFRRLYTESPHFVFTYASQLKFAYPFVVQLRAGCELHPGGAVGSFDEIAHQGSELVYLQNNSWLPFANSETRAQQVCIRLNQNPVSNQIIHKMLSDTCPRFLLGLLDAGKADLQRKVKPEAWLSTGPNPGPDRQMLVCHVSGFHPKPIQVMWMRGEQVQHGTQQSGILPNADGTWYLKVFLDVEATETSGLSCQVRHSSLEGQDIILYSATEHRNSTGLIILAVMVPLVLLTGLAFWLKKRWTHCEPPSHSSSSGIRLQ